MAMPERQRSFELSYEKSREFREILENVFAKNFEHFLSGTDEKKLLIFIKFVKGKNLVDYAYGRQPIAFPYADLKEKFIASFTNSKNSDLTEIRLDDYSTIEKSDDLPSGLTPFIGKRLWKTTTTYPYQKEGNEGIALVLEDYHDPVLRDTLPPYAELWTAKRVHFTDTPVGKNNDKRVSPYVLQPSTIRVGTQPGVIKPL